MSAALGWRQAVPALGPFHPERRPLRWFLGHIGGDVRFLQDNLDGPADEVPMSPTLRRWLREYLGDRARLGKGSEHLFTSLRGDGPLTYRGLTRVVARIKRATGIDFSPHRLRHTFATLMLEGGCDLFSLQKMMGHSDIKVSVRPTHPDVAPANVDRYAGAGETRARNA